MAGVGGWVKGQAATNGNDRVTVIDDAMIERLFDSQVIVRVLFVRGVSS